jgi:hypothetical protein
LKVAAFAQRSEAVDAAPVDFLLYRHVAAAWEPCIRPWLEAAAHFPGRSWVVVPSRGQAQAWKQTCVERGLPLLGVEFLTPGLARQKWVAGGGLAPAMGRELLLFGLGRLVDARLGSDLEETERALLLSLRTDLETALDDFDALLRAGFGPEAFAWPALTRVFQELVEWVDRLGFGLAPTQALAAAGSPAAFAARALVLGLGPENSGEFPNVLALVRSVREATLLLPEPEMRGNRDGGERWIEAWEAALGAHAVPIDAEAVPHCGSAVAGWLPRADEEVGVDWGHVSTWIAASRQAEAEAITERVANWAGEPDAAVAVVFARADALFLNVRRRLGERGVAFRDEIGAAGLVSAEMALQRSLLKFWEGGCQWPDLVELWPHLIRIGATTLSAHRLRRAVQRWFDATQTLALRDALAAIEAGTGEAALALSKLLPRLALDWPEAMTLADVLARCEAAWLAWETGTPAGWEALRAFAIKDGETAAPKKWLALVQSFLAEPGSEAKPRGTASFARVVLTTRRRADGAPWTHLWLAEANAGLWPQRMESSCWLPDERRSELASTAAHGLSVFTADERAWQEKCSYARLARDTSRQIVLSAALGDPAEPGEELAPNPWLERLLWASPERPPGASLEAAFHVAVRREPPRAPEHAPTVVECTRRVRVLRSRLDYLYPFDEYMLRHRSAMLRPASAAARVLERAMTDPAELWFAEVLGATGVSWEPLQRARRKWIGQTAHELVAAGLRGEPAGGDFHRRPPVGEALARARAEAASRRAAALDDAYWESCYTEALGVCERLLGAVLGIEGLPEYVAIEYTLPGTAWVGLGGEAKLGLRGRIDAVFTDQPEWRGASVEVVDFKTGTEGVFSAEAMAGGRSLQLGLYLEALRNLGVRSGGVWMVRPGLQPPRRVGMGELDKALAGLSRLRRHLESGTYGALTADQTLYSSSSLQWPLACPPLPAAVLKEKFARSFPEDESRSGEGSDEG